MMGGLLRVKSGNKKDGSWRGGGYDDVVDVQLQMWGAATELPPAPVFVDV